MSKSFYVLPKVIRFALINKGLRLMGYTDMAVQFVIQTDFIHGEAVSTGLVHLWCYQGDHVYHLTRRCSSLDDLVETCARFNEEYKSVTRVPKGFRKEI